MASKHVSYLLVVLLYGNTAAVASPQLADHGRQCAHAVDSEGKSQCDEVRLLQLRDKTTQPKVTPLMQQSICHVPNALITCPVLNALIKNGDLVPDYSRGCIIDKEMTRRAFLRTGISAMTANETTDANFHSAECPSCPMKINPRAMNSIDCGPPACKGESPFKQPHEHFRSTGIRDGPAVNVAVFDWIERNCLGPSGTTWFLSNNICFADSADCEREPCQPGPGTGPPGLYQRMLSNDIDVAKRPNGRYGVCTEAHSGREACPSQLHGSVSAMFQEFAHPSGPHGTLSRAEQRALWLRGEYPVSFSKRSPSSCMEFTGDERGCAECLAEVDASSPDALLLAERYCRCMHAQELSETALLALETYQCICQKASKGACAVQIRPIHGTTAHYNPGPGQMPGPERFDVAEFLRGKGVQAYDCKCTHGHPVPGTECDKHGQERCANCYDGYYLNAAYKCQAYDCKCTNGYPVKGKECDKYGHERCSGCYDGYYLTGAYKCESICHVPNALITCPVLNALIKNGDLVPDYSRGCIIDKEMTRRAFLRTGISAMTANETTDANFHSAECPSCPMKINPRAMNSIDCGPPACKGESPFKQPHEHFRSTGIRDGPAVNVAVFDWIERNCLGPSGTTWFLSNNICFADSADCEREPCQPGPGTGPPGLYQRMLSNDIDVAKRPNGRYGVCTEAHSGREACPSQLHGSVSAMFQEFAHPSGPHGTLSRAEQRALWLRGEYPVSFSERSPSSCMEFTGDERGCAECLAEVDASSPDALLLAERYCRCMHAQELSETALLALETYQCICQKASKGACAVQIRPIHGTTAHYNPGPGQMPGPERFDVAEFLRGKGVQAYDCKCTHGHPVPGTECDKHGQERCANCYDGYYLNAAYKCQAYDCKCTNGYPVKGKECDKYGHERCSGCYDGYYLTDAYKCEAPTCIYKQDSLSKCLPEGRPTADASLMACLARCSSKAACVAATFFPLGHGGWGRGARCYHLSGGCHRFPYVYSAMYWKLPGSCEAATHYRIAGGIDNETESMLGGQMIIKDDAEKDEKLRAARASAGGNDSENETTEMWGAENDTEATSATSTSASREGA